jgi:galactose mutarotase-like enzyme
VPFRQTTVSGFPAVALRTDEIEVVAVPALGMKLTNLRRLRGREWLWRNDQIPFAPPRPGASYAETADSGGWDECFPTVGPSPVPGAPAGAPALPDHGELWSAPWTSSVYEHAEGVTLTGTVRGDRLPYELQRDVTLDRGAPRMRLRYRLRHTGGSPFPWIWCAHPVFNVRPGTTLSLPGVRQVKLDAVHGRDDFTRGDVVSWPEAIGGAPDPFVLPEPGGWALKLFGDVGAGGTMALIDPRAGERLEIAVDRAEVPQVGVWICAGWAPAGKRPYYTLAVEPCIGAPDRLEDAAGWGTSQTLNPGEERAWSVEVRLPGPADADRG